MFQFMKTIFYVCKNVIENVSNTQVEKLIQIQYFKVNFFSFFFQSFSNYGNNISKDNNAIKNARKI